MSETAIVQKEKTPSERFMDKVVSEFTTGVGEIALTKFQKRLAQNYFVSIDSALKMADEKRLKKTKPDPLAITWSNVNMEKLARDVVSVARIGFDPAQPNHINMMPFKNNALKKYDIVFVEGYRGMELKATKYGLDVPDHVTIEIVYSTDKFKSFKKDRNNKYDTYEFEITNDFERGNIVGGFYYHIFLEAPEKNKLVTMSMKDIEKRKPQYASAEFWGGDKDVWENGQRVGKEATEGWHEKMVYKTIFRAAYRDITIDSQKIDDDYMSLKQMESSLSEAEVENEIIENGNRTIIDIKPDPEPEPAPTDRPPVVDEPSVDAEVDPDLLNFEREDGGPGF